MRPRVYQTRGFFFGALQSYLLRVKPQSTSFFQNPEILTFPFIE